LSSQGTVRLQVSDLLAHPGEAREETVIVPVAVSITNADVSSDADAQLKLRSITDGVVVRGRATTVADLTCTRCLLTWTEAMDVPIEAVFRVEPDDSDEELPILAGGHIDVGVLVHDEISLALPNRPLCSPDCLGLCPTCGNDLNMDPCDGHGEAPASPFSALRGMFADEPSPEP